MTTALNKTSVKLHDQTEAYERRLRDEKAKTDAKVSLMNQIKERADKQHKEYSLMRMENAGVLDKLNAEIKDYEAEMKLARAHIADKNILIERMHEESVEKDEGIVKRVADSTADLRPKRTQTGHASEPEREPGQSEANLKGKTAPRSGSTTPSTRSTQSSWAPRSGLTTPATRTTPSCRAPRPGSMTPSTRRTPSSRAPYSI